MTPEPHDRDRKRAVLLGAGHAHLHTIRRAAEFTRRGHELTLIAPEHFWYSGLATGMLGGIYPPSLDQIDVGVLVGRGGGRFVRDTVTRIDPAEWLVHLESGPPLRYDAVSLNLGSRVPETIPGAVEHAWTVKPIHNLWHLRRDLEARLDAVPERPLPLVVVMGAGATGCELAANIARLAEVRGRVLGVTVVGRGDRPLKQAPRGAARRVLGHLRHRGITFLGGAPVERVEPGAVVRGDGTRVPFDVLVDAIGLRPPPLVAETGLPTDGEGALVVDEHLRSVADPRVHGGGDCVAFRGRELAKIGVYAIRQAPVLCHNLLAALDGRPPRAFRPQRRFLLIINLGDGTGLATWGPLYWHGRLAFRLKDRIDRRFLAEYQEAGGRVEETAEGAA